MLRTSVIALLLRRRAGIVSMITAVSVASAATADTIDWNVNPGPANYDSALDPDLGATPNWINTTQTNTTIIPVSIPSNAPVGIPAAGDNAFVRNGGIAEITSAVTNLSLAVGAARTLYTDDGVTITETEVGGNGTVNMTGGSLDGSGGILQLRLGGVGLLSAGSPVYTGIFNQSGGTVTMGTNTSVLTIGSQGTTPTPTSAYTLSGGSIGVTAASNGNNGINVRNGTFTMTGGSISTFGAATGQRALTISSTSGTVGSENVATANFSAGVVDVNGGVRMASSTNTKAYMNISGTANLSFKYNDFQLGSSNNNAYAQVNMSGGSLTIGGLPDASTSRRLIIADGGAGATGSTGEFNLSDGAVTTNSLVVTNNGGAKGTLTQTGGTITIRSGETNRNSGSYDLLTESSAIIINGPNAVFTQQNNASGTGQLSIGGYGKARFEIQQGTANIREFQMSAQANSRGTLNVFGGKLVSQDGLLRTDNTAATIPTINLTGGELEFSTAGGAVSWQAGMELMGTDFDPKPGAILQTNIGNSTRPGNFSLNSGSIWELDIASNTLVGGADWVAVNLGTAALNGGLLNIHHIGGYTPAIGDTVRIISNPLGGVTLGGVAVSDPLWQPIVAAGGTEIHLTYVPEPSSMLLLGMGLAMFSAKRRTSRK